MTSALAERPSQVLRPDGERFDWLSLLNEASSAQWETIMRTGVAPRFEDLAGWEFAGANSRKIYRLIGIRKFVKGFYEGPPRDDGPEPFVQGYNISAKNNADSDEHVLDMKNGVPKRFGFYRVHEPVEGARDSYYPNALLLDYAKGGNGLFGPPLRDYVVQVYPDDPDLLLGKAYIALGLRVPMNYFVLKRLHEHDFHG